LKLNYLLAESMQAVQIALPEKKRIPFGWQAVAVGGSQALIVRMGWTDNAIPAFLGTESIQLRITAALDVRETVLLEAVTTKSRRQVGVFDIRYASTLQPFEIQLLPDDLEAVIDEGIELRMREGSLPFWILLPDSALGDQASLLFPHLLVSDCESMQQSAREQHMLNTLSSLSSLQPFGWLEGCVLDGLMDLSQALGEPRYEEAARAHLALYLDDNNRLKYEDPLSEPSDGKVYGIEGTLPFAAWARLQPDHPVMEQAISLWMSHLREDGAICSTGMLSAEGSYTVAYPMAVMARVRQDAALAEMAVRQLEVRRQLLTNADGDLYLRCYTDGSLTFRHWARAHAWYLLGLIRTLMELREAGLSSAGADRCAAEFVRVSNIALSFQSTNGLWSVFLDEPSTGPDTSGSAGIAVALALGANFGLLPEHARLAAERALQSLLQYVTPDGILGHVAQSNKGGEALQRSGYRVMFQMATGLLGQLYASLRR
jgi:unsaturated rhamnogalacturonyl hydrolase